MRYLLDKAEMYKENLVTKRVKLKDILTIIVCISSAIVLIVMGILMTFDVTYNTLLKALMSVGAVFGLFYAILLILAMYFPNILIALKPYINTK